LFLIDFLKPHHQSRLKYSFYLCPSEAKGICSRFFHDLNQKQKSPPTGDLFLITDYLIIAPASLAGIYAKGAQVCTRTSDSVRGGEVRVAI
jgi:hypothetical protein